MQTRASFLTVRDEARDVEEEKTRRKKRRGRGEDIFLTGNTVVWLGQKLPITSATAAAAAAGAACDLPHSSGCTDDSWPLKKKNHLANRQPSRRGSLSSGV